MAGQDRTGQGRTGQCMARNTIADTHRCAMRPYITTASTPERAPSRFLVLNRHKADCDVLSDRCGDTGANSGPARSRVWRFSSNRLRQQQPKLEWTSSSRVPGVASHTYKPGTVANPLCAQAFAQGLPVRQGGSSKRRGNKKKASRLPMRQCATAGRQKSRQT